MDAKLSISEIEDALRTLAEWQFRDDKLIKQFEFPSFSDAVSFVVKVGFLAEAADHHPDIQIRYRRVEFHLWTHSARGITSKDLALARQIEAAASRYLV